MPDPERPAGGLAKAGRGDYLGAMSFFPRPAGPRALWADLKLFWSTRTKVQWFAGTFAILIPIALGFAFWLDGRTNIAPGAQIIFVDSWSANRTEAETKARLEADSVIRNRRDAARRADFQAADNSLKQYGF